MPILKFLKGLFGGGKQEKQGSEADEWLYGGTWLTTASSWIDAIRYDHQEQLMEVAFKQRFKGGTHGIVYIQYPETDEETARGFYLTSSPGRYVWNNFYYKEYVVLSGITSSPIPGKPKANVIRHRPDLEG